jgi:hypothetical protein
MLRISNVSANQRFSFPARAIGMASTPGFIDLAANQSMVLPRLTVHEWLASSKQALAEMVAAGVAQVGEIDPVHLYQDKGHLLQYGYDYLLVENSAVGLSRAIEVATDYAVKFNQHVNQLAVHTAGSINITAATPTNLATLITWVTDAQIQYAAHSVAAAAHPTPDTWNTLALGVPGTLLQCIAALQELHAGYTFHKTWIDEGSFVALNIPGILTY